MRYTLQLPTDRVESPAEFCTAEAIAEIAEAIERAGFDAAWVTEHPFPPDRWLRSGGHHALDPFVALTAAAVATRRISLHTHILVLGYRNPFLLAKAAASLDVVSGGRLILGVAAGYLEAEFRALGAGFEDRNDRADEALEAMNEAWQGASMSFAGSGYTAESHTMRPRPAQRPRPPLWIGGNSRRAMRRAVRYGDGWCPFPQPAVAAGRTRTAALEHLGDLAARIGELRALERDAGRNEPLSVCFVPFGLRMDDSAPIDWPALRDQIAELERLGVDWLSLGLPGGTRSEALDALGELAAGLGVSERA
jgi:probable F420-dependent oxidoreductase